MKTTSISTCTLCGLALLTFGGCDSGSRKEATAVAKLSLPPEPAASKYTLEEAAKIRGMNAGARPVDKNAVPEGGDKFDENAAPLPLDDKNPGPAVNPANDPNAGRVKAEPGVAAKDFGGGPLGQPFEVFFGIKEKLAFGQVKHAMDLYKGLNGSFPKSHDEFMEKIIKDNGIKLPDLPEGNVYEYDPPSGDLYVAPAKDPSVIAEAAMIKSQALQVAVALLKDDTGKLADHTYPKVVELVGGHEKTMTAIGLAIKDIKTNGFEFQSYKLGDPTRTVKAGAIWFVGVPLQLEMKVPRGKLVVQRMLIGISDDERKTWYIEDAGADAVALQQVFPNLPEQFKTVPGSKPVFVAD